MANWNVAALLGGRREFGSHALGRVDQTNLLPVDDKGDFESLESENSHLLICRAGTQGTVRGVGTRS